MQISRQIVQSIVSFLAGETSGLHLCNGGNNGVMNKLGKSRAGKDAAHLGGQRQHDPILHSFTASDAIHLIHFLCPFC